VKINQIYLSFKTLFRFCSFSITFNRQTPKTPHAMHTARLAGHCHTFVSHNIARTATGLTVLNSAIWSRQCANQQTSLLKYGHMCLHLSTQMSIEFRSPVHGYSSWFSSNHATVVPRSRTTRVSLFLVPLWNTLPPTVHDPSPTLIT